MTTLSNSVSTPLSGRALVTGASGFVGSAVARCLKEAGLSVRALVRPTSPRANLAEADAEIVIGDLRDDESVARAMTGVRYLFHVAADYRLWARDPEDLVKTNVAGTRSIMAAALKAGVERVVYTSSVATLASRGNGTPSDESVSLAETEAIGAYKRSKIMAERWWRPWSPSRICRR